MNAPGYIISTKTEGRAEESRREPTARHMRGQMSRLRWAALDMTSRRASDEPDDSCAKPDWTWHQMDMRKQS